MFEPLLQTPATTHTSNPLSSVLPPGLRLSPRPDSARSRNTPARPHANMPATQMRTPRETTKPPGVNNSLGFCATKGTIDPRSADRLMMIEKPSDNPTDVTPIPKPIIPQPQRKPKPIA